MLMTLKLLLIDSIRLIKDLLMSLIGALMLLFQISWMLYAMPIL